MASDRLQVVVLDCIHAKHYGLIKGRTIQDCLVWEFEYLHQWKTSKKDYLAQIRL
jgi:hypothetical protein